jgi:hypothetical protein
VYLPAGKVPEVILLAFRAVRLTPLAAGKVAGNLASATVPVRLAAGTSIPKASIVVLVGATPVRLLPSPAIGLLRFMLPVPLIVVIVSTFNVLIFYSFGYFSLTLLFILFVFLLFELESVIKFLSIVVLQHDP